MTFRRWLPQFALRDFFWAVLLAASLVAWGLDHAELASQIDESPIETRFSVMSPELMTPSWEECVTRSRYVRFKSLSNDELLTILNAEMANRHPLDVNQFELALTELADRGRTELLREKYDELMSRPSTDLVFPGPRNLELLTALRRSSGEPNPITIEVRLGAKPTSDALGGWPPDEPQATSEPSHWLLVTATNRDFGRQHVTYQSGGNFRGGRSEHWHVRLTDGAGNIIRRSNYSSFFGGGVSQFSVLKPRDEAGPYRLDLYHYVSPPPSGKYYLQVFHHNSVGIARYNSLDGLIVSQSPLIPVTVVNPRDDDRIPAGLGPVAAILGLCGALTAVAWAFPRRPAKSATAETPTAFRSWRLVQRLVTRDACWIALIAIVALAYAFDHTRQQAYLDRLSPDAAAEWTLTFDETE